MPFKCLILFFLYLPSAFSVLFDGDHREEIIDAPIFWQEIARSVPAIVPRSRLIDRGAHYEVTARPLQSLGFCADARFAQQTMLANCSASLIDEDIALSAAHCFNEDQPQRACSDYALVFDYKIGDNSTIPKQNVAFCQDVLYSHFDLQFTEDLVIFKIDKKMKDRHPVQLKLSSLFLGKELRMIGYPLGIFQKWVSMGVVTSLEPKRHSFKHNLDTFSVNSGGPIFSEETGEQVGVLVRGTGSNFTSRQNEFCYDWTVAREFDFAEGNTLMTLQSILDQIGVPFFTY